MSQTELRRRDIIRAGVRRMDPIDNAESVARDHLSNERTLLAWIRTAVSLGAVAILLVRLKVEDSVRHLRTLNTVFGCLMVAVAFIIMAIGFYRYCEIRAYLVRGYYPATSIGFFVVTLLVCIILTFILVMILMG